MHVDKNSLAFFSALASETRLAIIEILGERSLNVSELAAKLSLSPTIIAKHVSQLEAAGILHCENVPGTRGLQRLCTLKMFGCSLTLKPKHPAAPATVLSIPVGQYVDWDVSPTCGFSTCEGIIGEIDDPRYFADPGRTQAAIIWWGHGHLTYEVPNYMTCNQQLSKLSIQLEICSEAPGYNESWPSDIHFSLNGREIGMWTCPGDFGERAGVLTPAWWNYGTQYGMLKTIIVSDQGSFIDGIALSGVTIHDLGIRYSEPISFTLSSPVDAHNPGGIVLFGRGFGNYDQDITVSMEYRERAHAAHDLKSEH